MRVPPWVPGIPSRRRRRLMDAFKGFCSERRVDPETGERNYCIVQAEDELAAIGIVLGAELERSPRVYTDQRARYFFNG